MLSFRAQRTTERYLSCAGAHDPGFVFALRPSAKAQSAASLGELAMVLMPTNETGDLPTSWLTDIAKLIAAVMRITRRERAVAVNGPLLYQGGEKRIAKPNSDTIRAPRTIPDFGDFCLS
jgi:hypothetical protein